MTDLISIPRIRAQVHAVVDAWAAAIGAKDAAAVVGHHAPGYTHCSLAPPLLKAGPKEKNQAELQAWFDTFATPIDYEIREPHLEIGETIAFCYSLNRMRGTRTDGSRTDMWFRVTLCLKQIDGAWKIAHEHESVPFYMDGSLRAATDLQPQ